MKNGTWQFCVDYCHLNEVTREDFYLLPHIDDALDYVVGSHRFSSINLRSGHWQVELTPEAYLKKTRSIGRGALAVQSASFWALQWTSHF